MIQESKGGFGDLKIIDLRHVPAKKLVNFAAETMKLGLHKLMYRKCKITLPCDKSCCIIPYEEDEHNGHEDVTKKGKKIVFDNFKEEPNDGEPSYHCCR